MYSTFNSFFTGQNYQIFVERIGYDVHDQLYSKDFFTVAFQKKKLGYWNFLYNYHTVLALTNITKA